MSTEIERAATESESPHLNALLSKLRPFQRTAMEFAVYGTLPSDEGGGGAKSGKKAAYAKRHSKRDVDSNRGKAVGITQVAGAGIGRILLGDEMGLGKTLTSLAIMLAYQQTEWPLLILCPASLRYTWPAEIEKFCPWIPSQSIHVVRGKDDVHFAVQINKWRNKKHTSKKSSDLDMQQQNQESTTKKKQSKCPVQIVIVTYSLLQTRFQIANTLRDCEFECIIADESHNLKQLSSQRCQLAMPLLQSAKRLVLLSGTPALNRPVELWPQLHALDAKGKMFGDNINDGRKMSYTEYTKRYCNAKRTRFGWDVKGVSNADELHKCLKSVMMRRLKSDVLHDLPSKQRSIVPVTISDKGRERESRDTMMQLGMARQAVSEITDLDADDVANSAQWEARKLLMQAYQASGIAKAPATTEYILDWLDGSDPTQKLIVFAHHKDVLDYIESTVAKKYKGRLGMMRIDGSVPPAERALHVKKFQSNKTVRLALLSMTAAGVGLTLTAASNIIFAELHWTPGVLAQAEDRCHRIGQQNSVNVMYCICKDEEVSVDMSLWKMLGRKVSALGRVVDGEKKRLNAVEKDVDVSSDGKKKKASISVEEELSTFFASSTVSSSAKPNKGPIVKGSIQSFFKKQAKKSESAAKAPSPSSVGKGKAPKSNTAACISLLDEEDDPNDADVIEVKKPSEDCAIVVKKSTAVFICHACTFENEADAAACIVCNTARASNTRTCATKENHTEEWKCHVCTYMNIKEKTHCDMCTEERQLVLAEKEDSVEVDPTDGSSNLVVIDDAIHSQHSTSSNNQECEFDDDDDEWGEGDFAAIDIMTQSHTKISQSPSSTSQLTSPDHSQKDSKSRECTTKQKPCQMGTTEILSFSVSKNSGRIALHLASSGQPLHVNFDVGNVLTKESADHLEETNLLRKTPNSRLSQTEQTISFDDGAIRQLLTALDNDNILPVPFSFQESLKSMCKELKHFVGCYLGLREVEKKTIKESGQAIPSLSLKQTVSTLLVSTVTGSTERYLGGAKERAMANFKNNCVTASDKAVMNGQACAWCAKPFLCANGATYCSQSCVEDGRLRRGGIYASSRIREQLFALEHGKCTKCNIDAHSLYIKIQALHPAERLNLLLNAKWKLPKTRQATDRLLNDPKEFDFWQADHELAVAEGGGSTGLDNLRTLCTPCHSGETDKLLARLKTMPEMDSGEPAKDGRTQMDIVSCFSNMKGDSVGTKKRRKRRRLAD